LGLGSRIGEFSLRVLLAGALLWICEVLWLVELRDPLDTGKLLTIAAFLASAVFVAEVLVCSIYTASTRFGRFAPPLIFALLAIPLAPLAAHSLFSGGFISHVGWVGYLKLAFSAVLVFGVAAAAWCFEKLIRRATSPAAPLLGAVAALAVLALSYLDTHFQVGLYPAGHLLLGAATLYCAALAAHLLVRQPPLPAVVAGLLLAGVLAAPLSAVSAWNSVRTLALVNNSNALMPKLRESVVAAHRFISAGASDEEFALPEVDPEEFRLHPTQHPSLAAVRGRIRHVVFVLVDAMREDHIGRVRDGESLTPFLDQFVEQTVRFRTVYSPSDRTGQSMPSLMTSLPFPVAHRLSSFGISMRTWIDALREAGFLTFANGNCDYVNRKYSHMKMNWCYGAEVTPEDPGNSDVGFLAQVLDFVRSHKDERLAVFTHWESLHVNENYEDVRRVYEDMVKKSDGLLAELVAGLKSEGVYDETLFVLTADHGYSLGDSNRFFSNQCCIEEQMRVPLLFVVPGMEPQSIATTIAGTDIVPTLLDWVAPEADLVLGGRSLLPLILNGGLPAISAPQLQGAAAPQRADYAFAASKNLSMLRRGPVKLVDNIEQDSTLAYDLVQDPREMEPIRDDDVLDPLAVLLEEEYARHARLLGVLVGRAHPGVPPALLAQLLKEGLEEEDIAPLLTSFWEYPSPARREILRTVAVRRLRGVHHLLDAVEHGESWEEDDQLLLVMRAWAGSERGCAALETHYTQLSPVALDWLAQVLETFNERCAHGLAPLLMVDAEKVLSARPPSVDLAAQRAVLTLYGLVIGLEREAPREAKHLLLRAYALYYKEGRRYSLPSWRLSYINLKRLLTALSRSVGPNEFDLLLELPWDTNAANALTEACLLLDDAGCRGTLLRVLEEREGEHEFEVLLVNFEDYPDKQFRREANVRIQAKYPRLRALN